MSFKRIWRKTLQYYTKKWSTIDDKKEISQINSDDQLNQTDYNAYSITEENVSSNENATINKFEINNSNSNNQLNLNNIDNKNIESNKSNQQSIDKSLNSKNKNIQIPSFQTNRNNKIQVIDQINNNQDQNKTESESENSDITTIVKVDNTNIDMLLKLKTVDDQIFRESEGESGRNNGSKHPTNELGLFTVPVDNEDQSSQFGNINLNLSIDTKKTQVSKDIDCGANTEAEIDKIDNSNQKIKLNKNNQNKSLNDNKNAIISTSPSQSNTDNDIQPLDQISDNQDQNKNTSESQNPENSTIDKVDYKNIDSKSTIKTADNIIGHQKDQSKIINNPPIGLPNPSSYCYLNSILQTLFSCQQFREEIIEIYQNNKSTNCDNENKEFVVILGKLFFYMKEMNEMEIAITIEKFYQYYNNSLHGNDISECFLKILSSISSESPHKISSNNHECYKQNNTNTKNNESITAQFSGQILFRGKCSSCQKLLFQNNQLFRSIPIKIPISESKLSITTCIESYFDESKINDTDFKCCRTSEIIFISKIKHSPQYIFIFLIRDSYNLSESKNRAFVEFDNYIIIPTENRNVLYKLRSVIDHIDNDGSDRYLVKTVSGSHWYLINDTQVKKINPTDVPTKYSIGLLIEKVTNINHNVPESLLYYNYNYQEALQSIIYMLYLCVDIRKYLIEFHTNDHSNENITENLIFKTKIGEMMVLLDKNETDKIQKLLKETLNLLSTKIQNIDQMYCCILDKLKDPTANINEDSKQQSSMVEPDLFGDDISIELKCRLCEKIFCEGIRTFKSITINEPISEQNVTISKCIENILENSEKNECNDKQQIISINQLSNSPQFIFIYLVRKSNKFIEFNNYINVPTVNGNVLYKLLYVIDQIDIKESKHYVLKTMIDSNWFEKSDNKVKKINPTDVPTKYTIGLLIEKVTNIYHNVPETLLRVNYNFQAALQSIFQMLYLCVDIRRRLIEFYTNYHSNEIISENLVFKRKIAEIMFFLENENESERIKKLFSEASNFLPNKIIEIHELYLCVVNKLNEKRNQINSNVDYNDSLDESGFKRSRIHCENCTNYSVEISQPQMFKSLYLKSQNNKLNLSKRIESFCKSQLDVKNDIIECCNNPKIVVLEEILSAPKYLFIYLDRIEGNVEDNKEFILNTQYGTRRYFLLSLLNYTIIKYYNGQPIRQFSVRKFESKSIHNPKYESIIAVMMERVDENISISNSENDNRCRIDMKTKDSFDSTSNVNDNLINLHISLHKNDYHSNISNTIAEEKLESDFIAQSIKQIIELNKDKKIHVLLGLLFSCTSFRNFMISLYNNYQIKKVFEKFALIDIGIFVNNICSLYHQVINRKTICSISKSDENKNIQQCFNYILGTVKLITKSEEFIKSIASDNLPYFNFINDNFYGEILLDVFCIKCSKKVTFKDSFNYLCVKKSQNESSISLKKCLNNYIIEENHQPKKKCCQDAQFILTRKIIHAPPILFICVDEKSRNINQNCVVYCDSILTIDTTNGPVTYSLVSLIDRNAENKYNVKFLGNSDWWQTYPKPGKINTSGLISKFTVGFLLKQLN